jgi:hypothetical protein
VKKPKKIGHFLWIFPLHHYTLPLMIESFQTGGRRIATVGKMCSMVGVAEQPRREN